jgi:hypothetical protein
MPTSDTIVLAKSGSREHPEDISFCLSRDFAPNGRRSSRGSLDQEDDQQEDEQSEEAAG